MAYKDLYLHNRAEGIREVQLPLVPTQFSLEEIKQHFDQTLQSIEKEYAIADSLFSAGRTEEAQTIWRSQVVFLEGLLDFYIHEISKYGLFCMFCGQWEKSEKYISIKVPMSVVETALVNEESKKWFFEYLNDFFSRQVFLAEESMRNQLNLIGIGFGNVMHKAFSKATSNESQKYGAKIVEDLYKRRNVIAHQNDRDHASAKQNSITKGFVEEACRNIVTIVNAIQTIAKEKDEANIAGDKGILRRKV